VAHLGRRSRSAAINFSEWILLITIWIAIAFWLAQVAGRKGHSFVGYFLFGLLFRRAAGRQHEGIDHV
jgi:hypothetical protein